MTASIAPNSVPPSRAVGTSSGDTPANGAATSAMPKALEAPLADMIRQSGKPTAAKPAVAPIGEAAVHAEIQKLVPSNPPLTPLDKDTLDRTRASIQQKLADPKTPPDLKAALKNLQKALAGERPTFTAAQMGTISVLQRHRDAFDINAGNIQQKIDDPKTPPDLKAALAQLKSDPILSISMDTAYRGGDASHCDGCISAQDLDHLSDTPEIRQFNEVQAKQFVANYIPSDDPAAKGPREMTENDAAREFYLYSDNLPSHLNGGVLKDIVEGQAGCKKCPPQVIAAAQYYRDHPAAWDKLTVGKDGKPNAEGGTRRYNLLDNISKNVFLNSDEKKTLATLDANRDIFFASDLSRKSLKDIVDNPDSKPEVKKAAQNLLDDPLLFGMLDNGKTGHSTSLIKSADDGKILAHDLDAFMEHLTTKDKKQPDLPPVHKASPPAAKSAVEAMHAGQVDDPEMKKEKGGALLHFMRSVISPFLKAGEMWEHAVSIAMSALTKIPLIGEIAGGISIAAEAVAGGLHMVNAGITGEDIKAAAIAAGAGVAGALVGLVVTGAGPAIAKGITMGVEKTLVAATSKVSTKLASATVTQEANRSVIQVAEQSAVKSATKGATKGATSAGEESATTAAVKVGKTEGTDQAKGEAKLKGKEELKNQAQDEASATASNSAVDNSGGVNGSPPMPLLQSGMPLAAVEDDSATVDAAYEREQKETAIRNQKAFTTRAKDAKAHELAAYSRSHDVPDPDSVAAAAA